MTAVTLEDIQGILTYFSKNTYRAKDSDSQSTDALQLCIELFKLDYSQFVINNACGELSTHYPSQLVILEYEQHAYSGSPATHTNPSRTTNTIYESTYDSQKLRDLINKARFARCRARFPLPVILFKGKYVCRSATLSGGPEIYGRSGLDYLFFGSDNMAENEENPSDAPEEPAVASQSDWQLFNRVRSQDIKLLKTLNVGTIVDFMVEKKKVKFGMNVTSSEKVDKENRYVDFTIISLPYPGCEFFREFRENDYTAQGLIFDWSQGHVDANIGVPDDPITSQLKIDWDKYKVWDLVTITQNYMRLLLKYLQDSSSGLLIHCISGWDRTPLFVSLLRLSLWADGVIHQSLDHAQILYLTIAYDWMLFGHNLVDRLSKGEEIFLFCFYMLKHLIDDEFSITGSNRVKGSKHSGGSSCSGLSVNRTDSDTHLDGLLLEQDSRGSNVSLNSSCSSVSTKSQEMPPVWFHINPDEITNGNASWTNNIELNQASQIPVGAWSPQNRRTSPVTVPVSSRLRQRQESSSSLSVGSWQMITGTGSLRGSDSTSTLDSNNSNANRCEGQISQDSSCTLIDEDIFLNTNSSDGIFLRKERLEAVRTLFYNAYCSTVGFKFKNGPDSSLGSFLGNIADRVGLGQRTSV